MRRLIALALLALALTGGAVSVYNLEKPTPAVACQGNGC
jgi:hypothetical protein